MFVQVIKGRSSDNASRKYQELLNPCIYLSSSGAWIPRGTITAVFPAGPPKYVEVLYDEVGMVGVRAVDAPTVKTFTLTYSGGGGAQLGFGRAFRTSEFYKKHVLDVPRSPRERRKILAPYSTEKSDAGLAVFILGGEQYVTDNAA
jgi:hypothetical protein